MDEDLFDEADGIDLDDLLADADAIAAGFGDDMAARFNTNHGPPGSGHGGQFVAAGGGGGGGGGAKGTKPAAAKAPAKGGPVKTAGPIAPGGNHAAQKHELHARAQADRAQAKVLEKQLHALHAQMKASVAAHHAAAKAAKSAKPGHAVHHRKSAKHHHRRARSLHARIAALRTKIRHLLTEARKLDAQAAKL